MKVKVGCKHRLSHMKLNSAESNQDTDYFINIVIINNTSQLEEIWFLEPPAAYRVPDNFKSPNQDINSIKFISMCRQVAPLVCLLLVAWVGHSLHINHNDQQQYSQRAELTILMKQQQQFEQKVTQISSELDDLTKRLADSSNDTQKVLLLQNSILSQRRQIHNMSTNLLPQFSFSKCSCQNLTEQEKIGLLRDLDGIRNEVTRLQTILKRFPKSERVDQMREDVEKQLFFVNSMKEVLQAKCLRTIILSPTIFQTNLYAPNWVLGNQTANQVVDDYYERSLRYDNVTNCPVERPFFNGQACMVCVQPRPVFDLFARKCINCGEGYAPNTKTKQCDMIPIPVLASNFNDTNYGLDGMSYIPARPADAVGDCPLVEPFFNGKKCISCPSPTYWSIPNSKCQNCPADMGYDINTKNCQKIVRNCLTKLDGPQWVTHLDNDWNVITGQQDILRRNSGFHKLCDAQRPFCDAVGCIACSQPRSYFNVDKLRCVAPEKDEVYNPNIHSFVIPLKNYQTMVGAKYILSVANITDEPSLTKCKQDKPYFDGLSCIRCRPPNNLFDTEARNCTKCTLPQLYDKFQLKCLQCNEEQHYNSATESCDFIPALLGNYQAENYVNLTQPLEDLQAKNNRKLTANPSAKVCTIDKPFFDGKHCLACSRDRPLFNHTSKVCTRCLTKEVYNPTARVCEIYYPTLSLTNTNAGNILGLSSLDAIVSEQQRVLSNNPKASLCSLETPYSAVEGCISCKDPTPLFDYFKKICTSCKEGETYNPKLYRCESTFFLTSLTASNLVNLNEPMDKLTVSQQALIDKSPRYKVCEDPTFFASRTGCISCSDPTPLFDMTALKCIACRETETYNSKLYRCQPTTYLTNLQAANLVNLTDTMQRLEKEQQEKTDESPRYKTCSAETPYFAEKKCINCTEELPLFNLTSKRCTKCLPTEVYSPSTRLCEINYPVVKLTDLNAGKLVNLTSSFESLTKQNERVLSGNPKASLCPSDSPYAGKDGCLSCSDPTPLFDYTSKECTSCKQKETYNEKSYRCEVTVYLTNLNNQNLINLPQPLDKLQEKQKKLTDQGSRFKVCEEPTPFSNKEGCIGCSEGIATYFDMTQLKCVGCKDTEIYNPKAHRCEATVLLTNFKFGVFVNLPQSLKTLRTNQQTQVESSPRYKLCQQQTPYAAKEGCISCKDATPLFDYADSQCTACKDNQIHNNKSSRCETIVMLTKLSAEKIVDLTGTFQDLDKEQQQKLDESPRYKVCADATPYFNGTECIACTDKDKPLFSYKYEKCAACRRNTWYDKIARKCLKERSFEFLTDLMSKNLIINDTIKNLQRLQDDILKLRPTAKMCPPENPYSNGPECISCTDSTPLFDYASAACSPCAGGTSYNPDKKSCDKISLPLQSMVFWGNKSAGFADKKGFVTDLEASNLVNLPKSIEDIKNEYDRTMVDVPNIQKCSSDKPYSTGYKCITCPTDQPLFNLTSHRCANCEDGETYNSTSRACTSEDEQEASVGNRKAKRRPKVVAPVATQTSAEPESSVTYVSNLDTHGFIVGEGQQLAQLSKQQQALLRMNSQIKQCPQENPYYNGKKCMNCKKAGKDVYFDLSLKQCVKCPENSSYHDDIHQCARIHTEKVRVNTTNHSGSFVTNLNSSKWVSSKKPSAIYLSIKQKRDQKPQPDICPLATPFASRGKCISCPARQQFNFQTEECEGCEIGKVFDVNTHSCLESIGMGVHQTNPTTAPNLVLGGISMGQYQSTYTSNKASSSDITDCPPDRPYFDNTNCVSCSQPFPYFNMFSRLCQGCGTGSKYNTETKQCEDSQGRMNTNNPTIQRMLSSIF